jgi:hypothetical protein
MIAMFNIAIQSGHSNAILHTSMRMDGQGVLFRPSICVDVKVLFITMRSDGSLVSSCMQDEPQQEQKLVTSFHTVAQVVLHPVASSIDRYCLPWRCTPSTLRPWPYTLRVSSSSSALQPRQWCRGATPLWALSGQDSRWCRPLCLLHFSPHRDVHWQGHPPSTPVTSDAFDNERIAVENLLEGCKNIQTFKGGKHSPLIDEFQVGEGQRSSTPLITC